MIKYIQFTEPWKDWVDGEVVFEDGSTIMCDFVSPEYHDKGAHDVGNTPYEHVLDPFTKERAEEFLINTYGGPVEFCLYPVWEDDEWPPSGSDCVNRFGNCEEYACTCYTVAGGPEGITT